MCKIEIIYKVVNNLAQNIKLYLRHLILLREIVHVFVQIHVITKRLTVMREEMFALSSTWNTIHYISAMRSTDMIPVKTAPKPTAKVKNGKNFSSVKIHFKDRCH